MAAQRTAKGSSSKKKRGEAKPNLKLKDFQDYLQNDLLSSTGKVVKPWFARAMLLSLGWARTRYSKCVFYDGHEREDVKAHRVKFLAAMKEFEKRMTKYSGEDCMTATPPTLNVGEKEVFLVVHDECTVYVYEDESHAWVEKTRGHHFKKKAKGPTANLSLFLSEEQGLLRMTDTQYADYKRLHPDSTVPQDPGVVMKSGAAHATAKTGLKVLGIAHNGYWTNAHVLAQVKNAVAVFEASHPGKVDLFLFDNSTGHNAYPPDALIASHMNSRPGGKQPHLRSTLWDGEVQNMDFAINDKCACTFTVKIDGDLHEFHKGQTIRRGSKLIGVQKGTKQVCLERRLPVLKKATGGGYKCVRHCCKTIKKTEQELFEDEMLKAAGKEDQIRAKIRHKGMRNGVACCCVWALSQCDDFKNVLNSVQELVLSLGHQVIFLPKFHPELNFIERFWSRLKWWLRAHFSFNLQKLIDKMQEAFDSISLSLIRKYARTSWRWMEAYRKSWTPELTTFAVKSYHGHRGVPSSMDDIINQLDEWNQHTRAAKGRELIDRVGSTRDSVTTPDLTSVDPTKLVGLVIKKDFDGFGLCEGTVRSVDVEVGTNRDLFTIEYIDGDTEDMFLYELVKFLRAYEVILHLKYSTTTCTKIPIFLKLKNIKYICSV